MIYRFANFLSAPCSPPIPPVNGFVFGDNHQHHAAVQFWCDEGYTLRGSAFSQCFDGKWDTRFPYCEGKLYLIICNILI